MNDTQLQILQLIQAMFSASPGKHFLDEFTESLTSSSTSVADFAKALTNTAEFKASRYGDAVNDAQFAELFLSDMVGDLVSNENKAWAVDQIRLMLSAGQGRGEVIKSAADALASVEASDPAWGAAAAQFNNKVEVSSQFSINEGKSGFTLATLQQVTAGVTNSSDSVTKAIGSFTGGLNGVVVDGYVSGATVFIDADGDGVQDPEELTTTSGAQGAFSLPSGANVFGPIVAIGGTDIASNQPLMT